MTPTGAPRAIVWGVALVASATLLFEVLLTRIFAVTLWYHFGFLAISLALMGTATSAVLCYLYAERVTGPDHRRYLWSSALLFAVTVPAAILFHLQVRLPSYAESSLFYLLFGAQLTLLFLAFFFSGMCISIALFRYAKAIGTVYFFDLMGAALGSLLVVPLMYRFSALALVFFVAALGCLSAWCFAMGSIERRAGKAAILACAALLLLATYKNDAWGLLEITSVKAYEATSVQQNEVGKVFEKWSPVSRVAVFAPENVGQGSREVMRVTADAGAPTVLRRFDGDYSKLDFLTDDSRQAVHFLKKDADTLVIGSAGGTDVLASLAFGQRKITAVEINPVTAELVTDTYADYIGRIFDDPRVTLHVQEGRNFVAGAKESYDIIEITMIDSWAGAAAGAYLFNENSLYTLDAAQDYLSHLKPDGILSVTRYYDWNEALRLTNIFVQALLDRGLTDIPQRLAILAEDKPVYRRATVLLKNGVFTQDEVETLVGVAVRSRATILHAPFLSGEFMEQTSYAELFRALVHPHARAEERAQILAGYPADLSAPTDDRPFFFFTSYLKDAFRPDPRDHPARRLAMPLLYGSLFVFVVLGLLTVFLPLYLKAGSDIRQAPFRVPSLVYFAALGVGFMLVELSLIQRLTVFLGHPTWSFVVVLSTLLCASGMGSYACGRWWPESNPKALAWVLTVIVLLVLVYVLVVYDQFIVLMALSKPLRILLAVAAIAPVGFVLGMCFPMGIQIVRHFHPSLVPWGWGVNGAFSVLGSILSIVLALNTGFKAAMAVGMASYMVALLIVVRLKESLGSRARQATTEA